MSFPRYETYKDSGVEWLGEVPQHWEIAYLRNVAKRYSGGTPDKQNLAYWENGTIPWLNSGSVNQVQISEPSELITEEAYNNSSAKWIPKDALVMALAGQGKTKGMVAQLKIPATCNQSIAAIIPHPNLDSRFLFWYLQSNYENIRNLASGEDRDGLNLDLIGAIKCPIFALSEQSDISKFLDCETAKIDLLITEQQRLIELLKEKRQALISHAVTKGLDPNVPMKDSGIEWLGKVPKHWDLAPLKRLFSIVGGSTPKSDVEAFWDGEISWITPSDLSNLISMYVESSGRKITYEGLDSCGTTLVPPETIILSTRAPIGSLAITQNTCCTNQGCKSLVPKNIKETKFFAYLLSIATKELNIRGKGTTFLELSGEELSGFKVPVPSQEEQKAIATYLDRETAKIDSLIADCASAIDLLKEKRSALISAVVTGKVDVRHLVEPT